MNILMFGKTGQVARELALLCATQADINLIPLAREDADLANPDACAAAIRSRTGTIDAVINAAAYTAVDKAEADVGQAQMVNGTTPGAMAQACRESGLPFLHISTDYVFDGSGTRPWRTDDETGPLGVYGRTKLDGERRVVAAGGTYAILRTSWVFSAHGANFVKTMLRLTESRDKLTVVGDQIGGPTPARAIAETLLIMVKTLDSDQEKSGIYHYSGAPDVSWADFAREIFTQAARPVTVIDIPTSDYPTPAARPANSRLECHALHKAFNVPRPDWRIYLADTLTECALTATP